MRLSSIGFTILATSLLLHTTLAPLAADPCDQPKAPETTRVYFANGMSNTEDNATYNFRKLRQLLTGTPNLAWGTSYMANIAYNESEDLLTQLLEVYHQRRNESEEFWYWLYHMEHAPQYFRDAYAEKIGRFQEEFFNDDPDLRKHIEQYLRDLKSGKKVVIVSHSQGNFYANNAYRWLYTLAPDYQNSIGIVSVATPARWVEGGGPYTNDPEDLIINLVRGVFPDTLAANVDPYDNPDSLTHHGFAQSYLKGYGGLIKTQIIDRIAALEVPEMDETCKDPEDVPVAVVTGDATNISSTSAQLNGFVQSGKNIATRVIWRKAANGEPATCWDLQDRIQPTGPFNSNDSFFYTVNGLENNTLYNYRVCGREGDRVSNGAAVSFQTTISCGTPYSANGGNEGLSVTYGMGDTSGDVQVEFEAFNVPDWLVIKQGQKTLYSTKAYVSGQHQAQIYHDASLGQEWEIRVYGNPDNSTKWELDVSCPN